MYAGGKGNGLAPYRKVGNTQESGALTALLSAMLELGTQRIRKDSCVDERSAMATGPGC